jgi:hypothetical protein
MLWDIHHCGGNQNHHTKIMTIKEANEKLLAATNDSFLIQLDFWNHRHSPPEPMWHISVSPRFTNFKGRTLEEAVDAFLAGNTPEAKAMEAADDAVAELPVAAAPEVQEAAPAQTEESSL